MKKRFLTGLLYLLICSLSNLTLSAQQPAVSNGEESLHGVLWKKQLDPPLRSEVKRISFSPDGKYVLAQDDASIDVLSREPFVTLFQINAPKVSPAQFTPDSQSVVFYDYDLRVQSWSVAERKLKTEHNIVSGKFCRQTELSPDGKTFACLDTDNALALYDVATNGQVLRKETFFIPIYKMGGLIMGAGGAIEQNFNSINNKVINMKFSPDGRYFAAGTNSAQRQDFLETSPTVSSASSNGFPNEYTSVPENITENGSGYKGFRFDNYKETAKSFAFDLSSRKQVSLGGALKSLLVGGFTFIAPDRILGANPAEDYRTALVKFPSGETIKQMPHDHGKLDAPGHGDYFMVRPLGENAVGVLSLNDGALLFASKQPALDLYDDLFVAEQASGELGLYGVEKKDLRAKAQLPRSPLSEVYAVALSPDFKWLAVSGRTRGAVWDVEKGERLFLLRSFDGAYYAEDGAFYVDFPEQGYTARMTGLLQTQQRQVLSGRLIETGRGISSAQYGQYLVTTRQVMKDGSPTKSALMEVKDIRTMTPIWSREFPKGKPSGNFNPTNGVLVLQSLVTSETAKALIKSDAALAERLAAMKEKEHSYLLQILDLNTGRPRGNLLVDTGSDSVFIPQVLAAGDRAVVFDTNKHIRIYSLASGEQTGQVAGSKAFMSKNSDLLCVFNENGKLVIYATATTQQVDQFNFSSPVAFARFSEDGKRLFVLTADQTAYVLDVSSLSAPAGK